MALPIVPSATVAFFDFTSAYMAWLQSVHNTDEFKLPIWLSKVVLEPVRTEVKLSTLNSAPVAFWIAYKVSVIHRVLLLLQDVSTDSQQDNNDLRSVLQTDDTPDGRVQIYDLLQAGDEAIRASQIRGASGSDRRRGILQCLVAARRGSAESVQVAVEGSDNGARCLWQRF